jgi:hypothetical protein
LSSDPSFHVFRRFNQPALHRLASLRQRYLGESRTLFPDDTLPDRLGRALVERRAIPLKEILESFEFFARTRRRVRRPVVVDLCCGHGLAGLLFAFFERSVERVLLIDERRPPSFAAVWDAVTEVGPWVTGKAEYLERPLADVEAGGVAPSGAGLLVVHGCGHLTDAALGVAIAGGSPIAVMPCCYRTAPPVPQRGLRRALGKELATDIARTYRLSAAGYHVDWNEIPAAITPKNRLLVAWNPP